jgi:hypothetical protein
MPTQAELTDARQKLAEARALVASVRDALLGAGDVPGARLLNEVAHALADEITAIDKKIAAKP